MFNVFHKSKYNSIVIFVIYNDQLITKKKNVIIKNNKLLKVFICLNSNYYIVENLYFVHQLVKKNLNFNFERAYCIFNLIVL